jgi:hypothetical protein
MLDRRKFLLGSIGAGIAALGGAHSAASATDGIRNLLKRAVGPGEKVSGMIGVVVDESGTRMHSFGSSGVPGGALVISNFLWTPLDQGTTNLGMKFINPDFHPVDFTPLYRSISLLLSTAKKSVCPSSRQNFS